MSALDCPHDGPPDARRVCRHLLETEHPTYLQHFTGKGLSFDLVCDPCSRNLVSLEGNLCTVCPQCVRAVEEHGSWEGIVGRPEIRERPTGLHFVHESVVLPDCRDRILDVQPLVAVDQNAWVAVTQAGDVLRLDLDGGAVQTIGSLSGSYLSLAEPVSLHLSRCGRMAAVVNTRGRNGVVMDLEAGKPTLLLDRGDGHNEHGAFPVAFCEMDGRLLLIHRTAWNRLDVSDPRTGELLTERSLPTNQGTTRPPHYLDYFHCGLSVSPGQEYIVDNGWVWHPWGIVVSWSLRRWLQENVWESEDGPSRKTLCDRAYYWDGPLCWIDDTRVAVWGYGQDDEWLLPAVRIFDVVSGKEERWFPGPKGSLAFDDYLLSFDGMVLEDPAEEGTAVWDVSTGECLLRDPAFSPLRYHPGAKKFLTPRPDRRFEVGKLRGRPVDSAWLSWGGGAVLRLARAIRDERAFDRLPILADALQDAGCADRGLLAHCRSPGPHGKECWAVERILDH